ncbi:COG4315 family predicted lipoprotein [Ramlibacter sp.]|uniref:COG4315 family predicted lipoprotein n=1 Tax=Ramlibacter sp. TaxID=1917967 RepID=UPI003FA6E0F5
MNLPRLSLTLATLALAGGLGACSSMATDAPAAPARVADGALVGPNGMTLYTFDRDAAGSGKSVCNGPCATNWPPLMARAGAGNSGNWTVVTRDDGSKQWAYKGKPVYYWIKDTKAGDRTGDGVNNAWRIARP